MYSLQLHCTRLTAPPLPLIIRAFPVAVPIASIRDTASRARAATV
jgi:hypothetical protein